MHLAALPTDARRRRRVDPSVATMPRPLRSAWRRPAEASPCLPRDPAASVAPHPSSCPPCTISLPECLVVPHWELLCLESKSSCPGVPLWEGAGDPQTAPARQAAGSLWWQRSSFPAPQPSLSDRPVAFESRLRSGRSASPSASAYPPRHPS